MATTHCAVTIGFVCFSVVGIVGEACGVPNVRCALVIQLRWKEQLESRRQHAHDKRATASPSQHAFAENGRTPAIALLPV